MRSKTGIPSSSRQEILSNLKKQYWANGAIHELFLRRLKDLIAQLVETQGLPIQTIESRVKSWKSTHAKAMKSPSEYSSLEDMNDICGLRIILWSDDHIDQVGAIIEAEFEASEPKKKEDSLMPDRFGYRSRHYIISLPSSRSLLLEWQQFREFRAEIQIRSALQHVWAQIEHDIGYKGEVSLPASISRRFARLAALLEIGDELIKDARCELEKYKEELPRRIEGDSGAVPIDRLSVRILICRVQAVRELDKKLAKICTSRYRKVEPSKGRIIKIVRALSHAGFSTVGEIVSTLDSLGSSLIDLVHAWQETFGGLPLYEFKQGFSVWLLSIAMAARKMTEPEFHRLAELLELDITSGELTWLTENATAMMSPQLAI